MENDLTTDAIPDNVTDYVEPKVEEETSTDEATRKNSLKELPNQFKTGGGSMFISKCLNVHIGDNNIFQGTNEIKTKQDIPLCDKIKKMFSKLEFVDVNDILILKDNIGEGWMELGLELGYSQGKLEQFKIENNNRISDAIMSLLINWKEIKPNHCAIGYLCKRLWKVKEKSAVQQLAFQYYRD